MKIKIYETKNLNLDTVEKMLILADKQANFNPESYWILSSTDGEDWIFSSTDGEEKYQSPKEEGLTKRYKELLVKWIGREAVINWLVNNQILFEVTSQDFLPEEQLALGEFFEDTNSDFKPNLLN